jgi:transposase-like protein
VGEIPAKNEAWKHTKLRLSKSLNNLVEQDHRGIKSTIGPMLGFKKFNCPVTTIAGIESLRRIRQGQFALERLLLRNRTIPAIWNAVLAA